MTNLVKRRARHFFHRILYHPNLAFLRRGLLTLVRRAQVYLLNCSTDARANGEEWLILQLPAGGVFLDVGFNRGSWSKVVLDAYPGVFVHGFDPCRDAMAHVERLRLPSDRFAFHDIALSNEQGEAMFYDYGDMNESNSLADQAHHLPAAHRADTYKVQVDTLDNWADETGIGEIDVLKIDAEGFDLHVLEGARRLLDEQRIGLIVFEYAPGWFASRRTLAEAVQFLSDRRYHLYRLFPFFLAPYRYHVRHEGILVGYFVALSNKLEEESDIPRRSMEF